MMMLFAFRACTGDDEERQESNCSPTHAAESFAFQEEANVEVGSLSFQQTDNVRLCELRDMQRLTSKGASYLQKATKT
jgi:hypothetical protein